MIYRWNKTVPSHLIIYCIIKFKTRESLVYCNFRPFFLYFFLLMFLNLFVTFMCLWSIRYVFTSMRNLFGTVCVVLWTIWVCSKHKIGHFKFQFIRRCPCNGCVIPGRFKQISVLPNVPIYLFEYSSPWMKFRNPFFALKYFLNEIGTSILFSTEFSNTLLRLSYFKVRNSVLLWDLDFKKIQCGVKHYWTPSYILFSP